MSSDTQTEESAVVATKRLRPLSISNARATGGFARMIYGHDRRQVLKRIGGGVVSCAALGLSGCGASQNEIVFACAAGWRSAVEPVLKRWSRAEGILVRTNYDGTGRLVSMINAGLAADLILTADASFLEQLDRALGYWAPTILCEQTARLVVRSGSDVDWDAVLEGRARLSLANESTAAISRVVQRAVSDETWQRLVEVALTRRLTVTEVASDVGALELCDAGIIWDTTWQDDERLKTVPVPELETATGQVALAIRNGARAEVTQLADELLLAIRRGDNL